LGQWTVSDFFRQTLVQGFRAYLELLDYQHTVVDNPSMAWTQRAVS
jgi:hypothetical protein